MTMLMRSLIIGLLFGVILAVSASHASDALMAVILLPLALAIGFATAIGRRRRRSLLK